MELNDAYVKVCQAFDLICSVRDDVPEETFFDLVWYLRRSETKLIDLLGDDLELD